MLEAVESLIVKKYSSSVNLFWALLNDHGLPEACLPTYEAVLSLDCEFKAVSSISPAYCEPDSRAGNPILVSNFVLPFYVSAQGSSKLIKALLRLDQAEMF